MSQRPGTPMDGNKRRKSPQVAKVRRRAVKFARRNPEAARQYITQNPEQAASFAAQFPRAAQRIQKAIGQANPLAIDTPSRPVGPVVTGGSGPLIPNHVKVPPQQSTPRLGAGRRVSLPPGTEMPGRPSPRRGVPIPGRPRR